MGAAFAWRLSICLLWKPNIWGLLLISGYTVISGCSMYRSGYQNLVVAPSQFQFHRDRRATEKYHQQLARQAITELQTHGGQGHLSDDYLAGYEAGIVSYLTDGGNVAPPLLPPRSYWKIGARTGTENAAAQQWLSGASDGREFAATSGMRSLATLPSSLSLAPPHAPVPARNGPEVLPQASEVHVLPGPSVPPDSNESSPGGAPAPSP